MSVPELFCFACWGISPQQNSAHSCCYNFKQATHALQSTTECLTCFTNFHQGEHAAKTSVQIIFSADNQIQ